MNERTNLACPERITGSGGLARKADINGLIMAIGRRRLSIRRRPLSSAINTDMTQFSFWCELSGSTVTVSPGNVFLNQSTMSAISVPQGTVTLSGSIEYVYLRVKTDLSVTSFEHSSALPQPTTDQFCIPLVKFVATGESTWARDQTCHVGDIHLFVLVS